MTNSRVFTQSEWQSTINQKPQKKEKCYKAKWTNEKPKRDDKGRVIK